MNRDLFRDDVLETGLGFYPGDFVLPLTVRILSVTGAGYNESTICPPSNTTDVPVHASSGEANNFFVTLTRMDELADIDAGEHTLDELMDGTQVAQPTLLMFFCACFLSRFDQ